MLLLQKNEGRIVMENNENAVVQTEEKTEQKNDQKVVEKTTEKPEKTYTQAEYNALDKKLKAQYEKKYEGIDIAEYKEWKESQKTEAEKQSEILKENESLKAQLRIAENKSVVANAGVDSKFQKFVISEVSELEGEFEENLKQYLEENPQFLTQKEEKKPTTTGFSQQNSKEVVTEEQAYLDKKYANNPYYKK